MQLDPFFFTEDTFTRAFNDGLDTMLDSSELGAFVLVLANATIDPAVYQYFETRLAKRFDQWLELFRNDPDVGKKFAADDVAVFKQLIDVGFAALQPTRHRIADVWQLQYNQLRTFRPARNATRAFETTSQAFDVNGFHFNKPFLQKEIFWQGELFGHGVRLLYNKFPFASLHGLFVVGPEKNKPQLLDQETHELVWRLLHETRATLPMGMGYNSLGAYASVNHQHLQSFVSRKKYPIELACWEHNGGARQYPLDCRKFYHVDDAWRYLHDLHAADVPYNLLYRGGELYCISRQFQGSYPHSSWTSGFAWSEVSGGLAVTSQDDFRMLDANAIENEMRKLRRL